VTNTKKSEGKQFTKQRFTEHPSEFGIVKLVEMQMPLASVNQLPKIKAFALNTLRQAGVEVDQYLQEFPHGSELRRAVIYILEFEPDSIEGLAARIYEQAAHVQGYLDLKAQKQATDCMAKLSELLTLFRVYDVQKNTNTSNRKGKKSKPRRSPLRQLIVNELTPLKANGLSLKEAIVSLKNSPNSSLRITEPNPDEYRITDDDATTVAAENIGFNALQDLFKAANKSKKRS
jgi:hypothetical protein